MSTTNNKNGFTPFANECLPQSTRMGLYTLQCLGWMSIVDVYHNQQEWIHKPNFKKLTAHLKTFHPGKINLK